MILNKRQLNAVEAEIKALSKRIFELEGSESIMDKIQINAWKNKKKELNCQIDEFYDLTNGSLFEFTSQNLNKLIISLRIASGMTQKQLAEAIEIKEQQIQRYEQSQYLTASFERTIQILKVLSENISLKVKVKKSNKTSTFEKIYEKYPSIRKMEKEVITRKTLMEAS